MNKRYERMIKKVTSYVLAIVMAFTVCLSCREYDARAEEGSSEGVNGDEVVALAESYIDKVPYVTGGNSLETGTDCAGFVILIYKQFGLDLSSYRSSKSLFENASKYGIYIGKDVSQARSGDLVFMGENDDDEITHVGIIKDGGYIVHQTVPGSSVKTQSLSLRDMGYVKGIVRPFVLSGSASGSLTVKENNYSRVILAAPESENIPAGAEYKWTLAGDYDYESEWTADDATHTFYIPKTGMYQVSLKIRKQGDASGKLIGEFASNFYHENAIIGICQMPNPYEGGGYLIGIESSDNPNQSYTYEMLILDCTLYSQGLPAWIYTTGRCGAPGNCLWTIWQPQYGYYWTLFRVYDENGNLVGEECYGFQNI